RQRMSDTTNVARPEPTIVAANPTVIARHAFVIARMTAAVPMLSRTAPRIPSQLWVMVANASECGDGQAPPVADMQPGRGAVLCSEAHSVYPTAGRAYQMAVQ